jgi:hypothetical protein
MRGFKVLALAAIAAICFAVTPATQAQISVGINLGPEPGCPYGYFDYAPYNCAPYGYYGPEWFDGGVFLGAGPWHHGHEYFYGHVNNRFDPNHGYHGPLPGRGEVRAEHHEAFRGNEMRDGNGHSHGDTRHH